VRRRTVAPLAVLIALVAAVPALTHAQETTLAALARSSLAQIDGRVSLRGTPYLAGSSLTLDRAIENTVRFTGLPIDDVIPMAATNPARWLGVETRGTVTAHWDAHTGRLDIRSVTSTHP